MVHVADYVFDGLCAPSQDALVVKLLGKNIGFHAMKDRLSRVWKLLARFDILDIGNNFYMVKFDVERNSQTFYSDIHINKKNIKKNMKFN